MLGNTIEAFQVASSAREYLDNLGYFDVQIVLMNTEKSEVRKTLGHGFEKFLATQLKDMRISF